MILLILPVLLILRLFTQQLNRAAKERERLLARPSTLPTPSADGIARDLHDGVVQELAGTAFSVFALSRDEATQRELPSALQSASVALRDSLKSLRSLLAEIHPPGSCTPRASSSALDDLIAPAAAAGIQASVSIAGRVGDRCAGGPGLARRPGGRAQRHPALGGNYPGVTVRGDGEKLTLAVVDDGAGFDPDNVVDPDRYGLRGLRQSGQGCRR